MSKRLLICVTVLASLAMQRPTCGEAVILVARPGSASAAWAGAFPTISAAVTAAAMAGGDEIWVQRGIYNENVVIPPTLRGIGLHGGYHGWENPTPPITADRHYRNFRTNPTVIDGGGAGAVVTFVGGCSAALDTVDGFWIKNGAGTFGGGVQIISASATVMNNTIVGNNATSGGGIGILSLTGGSIILANTICENFASACGGGIYNEDAPSVIRGNRIGYTCCVGGGNTAGSCGGGIAVIRGDPQIFHNTVIANQATGFGGGFYIYFCTNACIIGGNHLRSNCSSAAGSGILVEDLNPVLVNNTVHQNGCSASGWCGGVAFVNVTTPRLLNNIVSENLGFPRPFQVEANVFSPGIDIEDNTVWEPSLTWLYNLVPLPIRPVDVDPVLTYPCSGCNIVHHLSAPSSPCIDTGNNLWASTYLMAQPFFDFDGEQRIDPSGVIDRGADEYWSPSTILTVPAPYPTIQAALNEAGPGRTVSVAAGTYFENVVMKPCVTLASSSAPVTIDGGGKNSAVTVPIGVECTINDIGIRSGHAIQGGGINVGICARAFLNRCTIWDSFAEMDGGLFPGDPIGFGAGGGAYWAQNSAGAMKNCTMFGNSAAPFSPWNLPSATAMGGAVAMERGARPTLSWCQIWGNSADWDGGGVWVCSSAASPLIELCRITGNTARIGGGLYVRDTANPKVHNNLIAANSATQSGGGITVYGGGTGDYYSNTIADNSAPLAHQVDVFGGGPGVNRFINNIVKAPPSNPGLSRGLPAPAFGIREANCFWPDPVAAPDFTSDPWLNASYQLTFRSLTCIDGGNSTYARTSVDLDSETRIRLPDIDVGADEYYLDLSAAPEQMTESERLQLRIAGANPVRGDARIGYQLHVAAGVRLAVHDVFGRRVATLVDQRQEAGEHQVVWNGRRDDGREAPSGVYFLRLTAGVQEARAALVLTR
jgi:hypothetical protein